MKAKHSPNLKLLLLLVPILGTVLISGCTQSSGITFGNGVQIVAWHPSLSAVDSGDSLELRLSIQNTGEATAREVQAVLYGIERDKWGVGNDIIIFNEIAPGDKQQNVASAPRDGYFQLTAPLLQKGTTQTYTPSIRVYYKYKTSAITSITMVNDQELKRLQDQGKSISSKATTTSAGPLSVTVNAGKFMKVRELNTGTYGNSRTFPITIDVQNTGGGVVAIKDRNIDDYNIGFKLTLPQRMSIVSCGRSGLNGGWQGGGVFGGASFQDTTKLFDGKKVSITCVVQINTPPLATEDGDIQVLLDYGYYVDSSTTISVTGTSENPYGF